MDKAAAKALLINMVILAQADGAIDPLEREYARKFADKVGVSNEEANQWVAEAREAGFAFQPLGDCQKALDALKLLIGVVSADGRLEHKEANALVRMAKACDISREELLVVLKNYWNRDVLDEMFAAPEEKPREARSKAVLIRDHFDSPESLAAGEPSLAFEPHSLAELPAGAPPADAVVLHAAEGREESLEAARALRKMYPNARTVVILRRHQAFQIGYLMELGVHRCLVEPLFPNEIVEGLKAEAE